MSGYIGVKTCGDFWKIRVFDGVLLVLWWIFVFVEVSVRLFSYVESLNLGMLKIH